MSDNPMGGGAGPAVPVGNTRTEREMRTIRRMVEIYCHGRHRTGGGLCADCRGLLDYALERVRRCPHGGDKPVCAKCPIHCFRPDLRERVREVMRYAGPRMLLHHPVLALLHFRDGLGRKG